MIPAAFSPDDFPPEDRALLARAAALGDPPAPPVFPRDLDLATAAAYLRVCSAPANVAFARAVEMNRPGGARPVVRIGLVPGAFYRDHSHTGADGARIIHILGSLGHRVELIPVRSFGSLAENGRIILDWVRQRPDVPVTLISLSKGACDVKAALAQGARFNAWISLSGISTGTPLVRWLQRRPWRWCGVWLLLALRGQSLGVLRELRHGPQAPLAAWPALPAGLQIVHVHGFPLARHLAHPWAGRAYRRLAPLGPNDGGGVLLADVGRWPGVAYPLWGVDHYMQPAHDITSRLGAVFQTVLDRCA